jgi:hypothetical protein
MNPNKSISILPIGKQTIKAGKLAVIEFKPGPGDAHRLILQSPNLECLLVEDLSIGSTTIVYPQDSQAPKQFSATAFGEHCNIYLGGHSAAYGSIKLFNPIDQDIDITGLYLYVR